MKLDASALRYLTREDFRILSALEIGSKNHEVVPLTMIANLSRLRPGGVNARLGELAKHGLVSKEHQAGYEGFRLTYGGYDYLALHALSLRGSVQGIGRQIGVGKESDVYLVTGQQPTPEAEGEKNNEFSSDPHQDAYEETETFVLKIERLGRTSFRTVKSNRDYLGSRKHVSWMYMSRLAAEKEWSFLRALHSHGFPTPHPVDWNRHCIVMEAINGRILEQLHQEDYPEGADLVAIAQYLYGELIRLLIRLAEHGLIHGDFNEFNLMIREPFIVNPTPYITGEISDHPIVIIDFPQMVSTKHANAQELFDRDVNCLRVFFARRHGFQAAEWPDFHRDIVLAFGLDKELKASGHRTKSRRDEGEESNGGDSDGSVDADTGTDSKTCTDIDEDDERVEQ